MAGMWRINTVTRQLQSKHADPPPLSVPRYLMLQENLQAFLWIVGLLISLGTMALAFALQAISQSRESELPSHALWAYAPADQTEVADWLRQRKDSTDYSCLVRVR
jgi:hypothetical protein